MERRLRGRNPNRKYDFFYIGIGLVISIMAIFALTKPEENQVLFPFIFFFAAILRVVYVLQGREEGKKRLLSLFVVILLLLLSIITGMSLWR